VAFIHQNILYTFWVDLLFGKALKLKMAVISFTFWKWLKL